MVDTATEQTRYQEALLDKADRFLAGASLGLFSLPREVAFVVSHAQGSKVWDVTGRELLDCTMGSGPNILGHAHPAMVQAVRQQAERGFTYYYLSEPTIDLAEKVVGAVPCAEAVKFTTSGTDATFQALRAARAFTGRPKILKFEGAYHGTHDYALQSSVSTRVADYPTPVPDSAGIPPEVAQNVLIAPFNDAETTCAIVEEHATELAAVIVEPLQRTAKPRAGFLEAVRQVTQKQGIVLVFDEVVTGFRLAWGGAQERYGVVPDLAALGKAMAGGMPVGAICGRREIVALMDPSHRGAPNGSFFGGTMNGNPLVSAAALATLGQLEKPGVYERLHRVGDTVREGLTSIAARLGVPLQVPGDGPVLQVFFTDREVVDHRTGLAADSRKAYRFGIELLRRGIYNVPGGKFYLSLAHSDEDLARLLEASEAALKVVG